MYRNVIGLICVCAIVAAGLYAFLQHDRYSILLVERDSGPVKAYKIDKNTGKLWWIWQNEIDLVDDRRSIPKVLLPPEQRAINLVRNSETGITDEKIKGLLQARKDILKVHGWKTRKIDDQTHVVAYLYDAGPTSNTGGWIFEVKLEAEIVRPVLGDAELEKKYSDWDRDLQKKN